MQHGEAPTIVSDQPVVVPSLDDVLAAAGVPRSMPPELLKFARAQNLRMEEPEVEEEPEPGTPAGGQPDEGEVTLDEFDPTQIPEDADREWLAKRHQALVADYTKKTQGIASQGQEAEEARRIVAALENPATAPAMLAALGYEFDEEGEEPGGGEGEYVDPEARIAELEQRWADREQREGAASAEQAEDESLAAQIIELEKDAGREFDDDEVDLIAAYAYSNRDATGNPNAKAGLEKLSGAQTKAREGWVEKRRKAPRRMVDGKPGSKTVDRSDPKQRHELMVAAAEEALSGDSHE